MPLLPDVPATVASVITLMEEYGLQHVEEDPREANLNKIMQFIGVRRSLRFSKTARV